MDLNLFLPLSSQLLSAEHGDPSNRSGPGFVGKQIDPAEIPQYIREYERGKDLEMWMIMYSPEEKQHSNSTKTVFSF